MSDNEPDRDDDNKNKGNRRDRKRRPKRDDNSSDKPLKKATSIIFETSHVLAAVSIISLLVEWIATQLKASRDVLAASTPFNSVVIPPHDAYEWAAVIGAYCVLVACAAGLGALVSLRGYIWAIGLRPRKWIERVFELVGKNYLDRHYAGLLHVQFGLRMLLVLTVLITALTSLGHRGDLGAPDAINWIKWCHIAQVYICAAFLAYSLVRHFLYDAKRLSGLQMESAAERERAGEDEGEQQKIERKSDEQASAVFVRIAWLDIAVISLIWCITMLPDREFYLAYLLPLMGVWLVGERQSVRMIGAIAILVMIRGAVVMSARIYEPQLSTALGITNGDRIWLYAGSIVPKFALFGAVAFLVVTLRYVHFALKSRIVAKHERLETVMAKMEKLEADSSELNAALTAESRSRADEAVKLEELADDFKSVKEELEKLTASLDEKQKRLRTAEQHALVESALAKLSDSEGHAVFIKDVHRRFVFANDEFLKLIAPTLYRNFLLPMDEKPHLVRVKPGERVRLEDIRGRTDHELGIEIKEYVDSDNAVLGLPDSVIANDADRLYKPDRSSDHFEGAEHCFADPEGAMPRFWTIKHALRDEGDKVWGLVGEVLHGEQEFMHRLSPKLLDEFPLFVSVKEPDGHVIYMNRAMLNRMAPKIMELSGEAERDKPLEKQIAAMRGGLGPLDSDLYGDQLADEYRKMDKELERVADDFIRWMKEKRNRISLYSSEAQKELARRLSDIEMIKSKGVSNYPQEGWIESHRFPGEKSRSWVEVRKLPIIQETQRGAQMNLECKGILVAFQDVTQMYLRRCIVWHWVEEHFRNARRASAEKVKGRPSLADQKSLPLLSLMQAMLRWVRRAIDDKPLDPRHRAHEISELHTILKLAEDMYDQRVKVELSVDNSVPTSLPDAAYYFFAVVLALTMNAIEARLRAQKVGQVAEDENAPVRIKVVRNSTKDADRLVLTVEDRVVGLDSDSIARINSREMLRYCELERRELPGGGLLLTDRLAGELSADPPQLSSPGPGKGSTATFEVGVATLGITAGFPGDPPEYTV